MIFGDKSSSWNKIINAQSIKSEFHVISDFNRKPNYCSSMYVVINVHDQFKQYFDAFFFVLLFYDCITIINLMFLILCKICRRKKKKNFRNKQKKVRRDHKNRIQNKSYIKYMSYCNKLSYFEFVINI